MEYTNMSFLYDFAFMSLLLIIAQFLRSRIKFLQMFYIPASVLAGLMGLVLGPQFLNVIPWSGKIGSYVVADDDADLSEFCLKDRVLGAALQISSFVSDGMRF